jgi:hypothetical protein
VENIQIMVFWILTPSRLACGYKRFGGTCCLHIKCRNACGKDVVGLHRQSASKVVTQIRKRGKTRLDI